MARKGKEIQLQREIETQEEWEDMLSKDGLCVVDVFQDWAGPVIPLIPNLRRLSNELCDELLKFYVAKADTIDALEKYRGRCEPCFLFYAGGILVSVIRGANAPLILRTVTEQLAQEHKVLDGHAERKEVKDQLIAQLNARERQREEEEEEEEEPVMEVTAVIIKPDAVQSGKAEEILDEMKKRGIQILRQEERLLTEDEVKNVYTHLQDESYFNELITFMTSSPSIVLAITKGKTGENIIKEFRELIGPTAVEDAKEAAPDSLRAKFGQENYKNAVHGSDSSDTAARELAFFFPDFAAPRVKNIQLQRTLALIRPDAYKNSKDAILAKIREAGFKVAMEKEIQLTKEQAEEFYREHEGQDYFEELTTRMSCGPLLALGLAREEAIAGWRDMLGPTKVEEAKEQQPESLRAVFSEEGTQVNMLHGSDSVETAKKELEFFFPVEQTIAMIKPDAIGTKDKIIHKIHEAGFRIAARKETRLTRDIAEEFYSEHADKPYYNELVEHMTSGSTYLMVLSREGAVDGWRSLIGPTDPAKAKELDVETNDKSIRGEFGTDKLRNAVHGSSNADQAKTMITKLFGELTFDKDGCIKDEQEETEGGDKTDVHEQDETHEEDGDAKKTEGGDKTDVHEQDETHEEDGDAKKTSHDEQQVEEHEQVDTEEDQTPKQTSEAQEPEPEVTAEQQEETKDDKVKSPEPQAQEERESQSPEQATEEQTEQEPSEPEQAPAEQQAEATEEPAKTEEEPAKTTEEPAKTEEEPAKTTEEPAKTEEEPAKTAEEQTKTEEEPAKTEEPKVEEQANTEETKQDEQKTDDASEQKKEDTPAEGGQ